MSVELNVAAPAVAVQGEEEVQAVAVQGGEVARAICVICHNPLDEQANTMRAVCNHVFHQACLQPWMNTRLVASCPTCRGTLDGVVLHVVPNQAPEVESPEDANRRVRTRCGIVICAATGIFIGLAGAGVFR